MAHSVVTFLEKALALSCACIIVESLENTRSIGEKLGKDLAEFVENLLGNFFGRGGRRIEPGNL